MAASAAALVQAGTAIADTVLSAKAAKKQYKLERRRQRKQSLLAAHAVQALDFERQRAQAAEETRRRTFNLLGAPGTYDLPGAAPQTQTAAPAGDVYQTVSGASPIAEKLLSGKPFKEAFAKYAEEGAQILDPEKATADISSSAMFRIQSRKTAEAEQLLAGEGPMYDMLHNSVMGPIVEGSATMLREQLRDIRTRAAKGGSARRTALKEAQEMAAQEMANRQRVQETWNANLKLWETIRNYSNDVAEQNYRFLDNIPMIRGQYQETMSSLADMVSRISMYGSANMPTVPKSGGMVNQLIAGGISAVGGIASDFLSSGAGKNLLGGSFFGQGSITSGGATKAVAGRTGL